MRKSIGVKNNSSFEQKIIHKPGRAQKILRNRKKRKAQKEKLKCEVILTTLKIHP